MNLRLGRAFRRMGLPFWTFIGIGISAIWFNSLGNLGEAFVRRLLIHWTGAADTSWMIDLGPKTITFAVPFVAVFVLVVFEKRRARGRTTNLFGGPLPTPEPRKGLIVLVSKEESAAYAIRYHAQVLQRVWLIPSDNSREAELGGSSIAVAESVRDWCAGEFPAIEVEIDRGGVSPADAQDTFDAVNRIFRRSGLKASDIIADFTGGTKPMSVGMIMACLPADRELQYVPWNSATGVSAGPYVVDYQHRAFGLMP